MSELLFFDSLTHASRKGNWLDRNHFDASLNRLLTEIRTVQPYRTCLVNIAGYSDNDELLEIANEHKGLFVPIAGFDPSAYSGIESVDTDLGELAELGFAGIKLHPRLNCYNPLDERVLHTVHAAHRFGLTVFIDTLFRQKSRHICHPADVIDNIAFACPDTQIVLLHGGASAMLDIYEVVRMRSNILLDTSFTMMRYAGSSLDDDMRFIFRTLDQRATVGSDFPEYGLSEARGRISEFLVDLSETKAANIMHRNLERFLDTWLSRRT